MRQPVTGVVPFTMAAVVATSMAMLPSPVSPQPVASAAQEYGYFLSNSMTPVTSARYLPGRHGDVPLVGDWDGDGVDSPGFRTGNVYDLLDENEQLMGAFVYGRATDAHVFGFWQGRGVPWEAVGVHRGRTFYLSYENASTFAWLTIPFGRVGDAPLVGDWDGDGKDTLGVRRDATFFLTDALGPGPASTVVTYGRPGDVPVVGDWDGDGVDTVGVRRGATFHLRNSNTAGPADVVVTYGRPDDVALVGDWDGDGTDTVGVYRKPPPGYDVAPGD